MGQSMALGTVAESEEEDEINKEKNNKWSWEEWKESDHVNFIHWQTYDRAERILTMTLVSSS